MALPDPAVDHYRLQARQAAATAMLARRLWRRLSVDDLDRSWAQIVARLTLVVSSAMTGAAAAADGYVAAVLDDDVRPDGKPVAAGFGASASDGRRLDTLLFSAVVRTRTGLGRGLRPVEALAAGGSWLDTLTRTQVADAGRSAVGVGIAARPRTGYVRMVSPPCCARCAVLAGKLFRWNDGFRRHPGCDCRHVPCSDGADPAGLTANIGPGQITDLTDAQRQAVADGADLGQVVNANRAGARSADGMTTSEGITRRGLAGQRGARRRLTPEAIYRVSSSREEAVARLRANGYLL